MKWTKIEPGCEMPVSGQRTIIIYYRPTNKRFTRMPNNTLNKNVIICGATYRHEDWVTDFGYFIDERAIIYWKDTEVDESFEINKILKESRFNYHASGFEETRGPNGLD